PSSQRLIAARFDLLIHSATKYLTGHSDLVGGVVVVVENKELGDQIALLQNSVGAIAGPFESFLVMRSLKTLALRMERHCSNAIEIARWLEEQPQVKSVSYPGLKSHPQHDLARQQMRGFGGMVTIILKTDLAGTKRFLENTHLFSLAESLGGVESLINHPALMTHASVPKEQREALGVSDSLVRLSVGVADVRDLIPCDTSRFGDFSDAIHYRPVRFFGSRINLFAVFIGLTARRAGLRFPSTCQATTRQWTPWQHADAFC